MDKQQEILEVSKLVFELTMVGTSKAGLNDLLERLFNVLQTIQGMRVLPKGAVLLYNPRQALVQVAELGMPPHFVTSGTPGLLDGIAPEFWDSAYVTTLSAEKALRPEEEDPTFVVLPLSENERQIGLGILFIEPDWQLDQFELKFMSDLAGALSSLVTRKLVDEILRVRELELEDARTDAIRRLGAASEYRDNETGMHVMRMTHFSVAIAREMGLPDEQRNLLAITAPMHDVGKIGIADAILLKPGQLTPEEFEVMKSHTEIGERILKGEDSLISVAREIALSHHEHWDGTGYPRGLRGEEISIFARICALADVFDALTTSRPYKEAWPVPRAIEWIQGQAGKKFDPEVVSAFERALGEIRRIRDLYRDDIINPHEIVELPEIKATAGTPFVTWDDSMRIGIDAIDAHHLYLVELLNDLFDVISHRRGSREVGRVLKALEKYVHVHFRAEERMMSHYGYAGLDRQHHQHQRFEKKLRLFYSELHENPLTAPYDMLAFLSEWLVHHIRQEDSQLRALVTAPA